MVLFFLPVLSKDIINSLLLYIKTKNVLISEINLLNIDAWLETKHKTFQIKTKQYK